MTSTVTLTVEGVPDGDFMTVIDDENGARIQRQTETYLNGSTTITIPNSTATAVNGYASDGNQPALNGYFLNGLSVPDGFNPLTSPNIILTGSSLVDRAMTGGNRITRIAEVATHLGFTGNILNHGIPSNTMKQNSDYWVSSIRGQSFATDLDTSIMVTNGNDVSSGRPYDTDTNANTGILSNLADEWQERFDRAAADVGMVIPTECTFRAYNSAPIVDVHDLAGTEDNGSLPYNDGIFNPLIATSAPQFSSGGKAVLDMYSLLVASPWVIGEDDGVHLVPEAQHCFVEYLLLKVKQEFDSSVANVSGKTVIVYPQNQLDYLDNATGYTPLIMLNAKVIDTDNNAVPHLFVKTAGASTTVANGSGSAGNSRVSDSDLHGNLLLEDTIFAAGANLLNELRQPYLELIMSGLPVGATGTLTMACCRDGTNATSRQGNVTLNGLSIGVHDAASNVASNQIGPVAFTADNNGEIILRSVPVSDNGFSYLGPTKFVFD